MLCSWESGNICLKLVPRLVYYYRHIAYCRDWGGNSLFWEGYQISFMSGLMLTCLGEKIFQRNLELFQVLESKWMGTSLLIRHPFYILRCNNVPIFSFPWESILQSLTDLQIDILSNKLLVLVLTYESISSTVSRRQHNPSLVRLHKTNEQLVVINAWFWYF